MNTTSSSRVFKRWIGTGLIDTSIRLPALRPWLQPWGLRTSREWFGNRIVSVTTPGGRPLRLASVSRNYLSFELYWKGTGYYEPISLLLARELVQPGDTFLDVGANIGFYSLVLSLDCPGLHVVAFEPNPKLRELLQLNADANDLGRLQCHAAALSDSDGEALLHLNESDMSASLRPDFDLHQNGAIPVPTRRLDSILAQGSWPGRMLIKLDVEGHEEAFFEGARESLTRYGPDLISEVAADYSDRTVSLLKDCGYRFFPITDEGLVETTTLRPTVRGDFVFLNHLLSRRTPWELAAVFGRIESRVRAIDLARTSKLADPRMIAELRRRQTPDEIATPQAPPGLETESIGADSRWHGIHTR